MMDTAVQRKFIKDLSVYNNYARNQSVIIYFYLFNLD